MLVQASGESMSEHPLQASTAADGLCPSFRSEDELHMVSGDSDCLPTAQLFSAL